MSSSQDQPLPVVQTDALRVPAMPWRFFASCQVHTSPSNGTPSPMLGNLPSPVQPPFVFARFVLWLVARHMSYHTQQHGCEWHVTERTEPLSLLKELPVHV